MGSSRPPGPADASPAGGSGHCPICRAPSEPGLRPFCSRRCADVDLSRWLRGAYAIPVRDDDDDEDGDAAPTRPTNRSSDEDDRHG
ncbi:MAG: DNA gyrase inhibitor YacG [Hyphomicrobiaceae bacterium]